MPDAMNNYMKYKIYLLLLFCVTCAFSQQMPLKDQRLFRLKVYYAMEEYEKCASLYDNSDESRFRNLFESGEKEIYCDLLGISTAEKLSVNDYIGTVVEKDRAVEISIHNVNFGPIYESNGRWCLDVFFDKEMRYYDNKDIPLSSKDYYGSFYNLVATFMLNDKGQAKIVELKGRVGSEKKPLPESYFAIERTKIKDKDGNELKDEDGKFVYDPRDMYVLCNGYSLDFMNVSELDYALVSASIDTVKFVYTADNDIRVKPFVAGNSKDLYSLKYTPIRWRMKLHYGLSLLDNYNIKTELGDISANSFSNEFAVDFGFIFPTKGKFKVGLYTGVGMAMNKFDMSLSEWNYSVKTFGSADIDSDPYTRYYSLKNVKQAFTSKDISVPLYIDLEYRFSKWFSLYADVGAKAYFNIDYSTTAFNGEYSVYGIYEKYDNLRLDYLSGINGFTNEGVLGVENLKTVVPEFETASFDVFGGIGFRVGITGFLQFDCSLSYQMGLNDYLQLVSNPIGSTYSMNDAHVMYSAKDDKEFVRSMLEAVTSFKRQTLKLNLGLLFKF